MSKPILRRLGNAGLTLSATGLGCNNLGRPGTATAELAACRTLVDTALDAGITHFDVAETYCTETGVSEEILEIALALAGTR